ncbi:lamin tail domain-containing protein 1 [Bombina bombina]|uniref:lamin tail domain-containing protein 1 n=1 Tax=Bombina bombina TaxID=8345 RepID=UPI00235B13B2|nr:lamin tail domain-containing protein 1 [Bombina bombina]
MISDNRSSSASDILRQNSGNVQLQDIRERFSNYIRNVKSMRNHLKQADGLSTKCRLENEILAIRNMYEQEVQTLREKLEQNYNGQIQDGVSSHRETLLATEYQNRLLEMNTDLLKKDEEINALSLLVAQKEADIQTLKMAAMSPSLQLDLAKQELEGLQQNILMAQQRYEEEFLKRLHLQDQVLELTDHIKVLKENHMKELYNMRSRVDQSETLILQLEDKVRAMSRGGPTLMETVQKIQEASETEVKRLQTETENLYNHSLLGLQMRANNDQLMLAQEQEENQHLHQRVEELTTEVASLEKKLLSEEINNRTFSEKLQVENIKGAHHIRALEARLEEVQDLLLAKMKELSTYQDKNTSLGNELDTLKLMLQEEELQMSDSFLQLPVSPPSSHSLVDSLQSSLYDLAPNPPMSALDSSPGTPSPLYTTDSSNSIAPAKSSETHWKTSENGTKINSSQSELLQRPNSAPPFTLYNSHSEESQDSLVTHLKNSNERFSTRSPAIASATGDIKISEVDPSGHFVRLMNTSDNEDDIGGFVLQQNICGHPVSLYRFPPNVRVLPNSAVTVWAADTNMPHKPPTDFLWKEQKTFVTKPQCTTILCMTNGQAIAWYTPVSSSGRRAVQKYEESEHKQPSQVSVQREPKQEERESASSLESQPRKEKAPVLLRREKLAPAIISSIASPWTQSPASPTHPDYSLKRCQAMGNDSSSSCRQSRSQTSKPEAKPGLRGAGSRSVRSTSPGRGSKNSRGPVRSATARKGTLKLFLPGTFFPLSEQHRAGLQILQSVQNLDFLPPMPPPPPLSSW